jgi:hypothetical protein
MHMHAQIRFTMWRSQRCRFTSAIYLAVSANLSLQTVAIHVTFPSEGGGRDRARTSGAVGLAASDLGGHDRGAESLSVPPGSAPSEPAEALAAADDIRDERSPPRQDGLLDALVISGYGPTSYRGCGVRQMALMMDLYEYNMSADILTQEPIADKTFGWSSAGALSQLSEANFWSLAQHARSDAAMVRLLERYRHIFFFGWFVEAIYFMVSKRTVDALESRPDLKNRVTLILDDNPLVRCPLRNTSICEAKAPAVLKRWLSVSSRAAALTSMDRDLFNKIKRDSAIDGPNFRVWPMRLEKLSALAASNRPGAPERSYKPTSRCDASKKYLTITANKHLENVKFVREFFISGGLEKVCAGIDNLHAQGHSSKSTPKVLFVGGICSYIEESLGKQLRSLRARHSSCVELRGEVSTFDLYHEIYPQSRAVVNPIPSVLTTGISVKTYQSIALQVPLITSQNGLRGLEHCRAELDSRRLLALESPLHYSDLIVSRLLDSKDACEFQQQYLRTLATCLNKTTRAQKKLVDSFMTA